MAIADTITSMQNHTSNAYTMIGYGTDLTGINKNLENLSTSIFNAFLEALRNPDTLFTNLPKKSGTGANITLNDTANAPMRIELGSRALEQATTTGKNLLPNSLANMKTNNTTGTWNNNAYTLNGITWTPVYENGLLQYINANGTATAESNFIVGETPLTEGTTYTGTGCPSGGSTTTYRIFYSYIGADYGTGVRLTSVATVSSLATARVYNGATANNLKFYPMVKLASITDTTYEPYTNGASPNPSYPQDIHTISGSNKVVVCGKNLFDKNNANQLNSYWNSNKIVIDSQNNAKSIYIKCEPNTTYTISKNAGKTFRIATTNITPADNVSTISSTANHTATSITITTEANANYLWVNYFNTNNGDTGNYLDMMNSIMIEKGSTATTYTPYTLQEADIDLKSYNLLVPNTNKNAITTNGITYTPVYNGNELLYVNVNGTATADTNYLLHPTSRFDIDSQKTYFVNGCPAGGSTTTYSILIYYYDSNNTYLGGVYDVGSGKQIPSASKILANIFIKSGQTFNNAKFYPMLIEGTTNKQYIPYYDKGEYCKIGNYEDKFIRSNDGTWQLEKNIGKVVLDGTEEWIKYSNTNIYFASTNKISMPVNDNVNCFSNYYQSVLSTDAIATFVSETESLDYAIGMHTTNTIVRVKNKDITTETDIKNWFSSNNTEVFYILATPTYTQITGTLANQLENVYKNMLSQTGVTNISQANNDLSFELSVSAIEDLL